MAKRHKVAVYGTLMAGERNERWAADALDRRPCVLRGTLYDTGRGYPAFVPDDAGGEVKAELRHDATPAPGADKNDVRYILGLGWKF